MFLSKSPPRFVRRSRLEHLGLLLLRALILALLALAFARPYLPADSKVAAESGAPGRVAVLVDTSASMRRGDLWSQARGELEDVLAAAPAGTQISLVAFDRAPRFVLRDGTPTAARDAFETLAPGWFGTDLGRALIETAEELAIAEVASERVATVVLLSDLQSGAALAGLETYDWPERVELDQRRLSTSGGNASLQAVASETDRAGASASSLLVRITNSRDATRDRFELEWRDSLGEPVGEPLAVQCPAGESRVVKAPALGAEHTGHRLVLSGDDAPFDNTLTPAPRVTSQTRVYAPGTGTVEQDLEFFLSSVFGEEALERSAAEVATGRAPAFFVTRPRDTEPAELRQFVDEGHTVLVVLSEPVVDDGVRAFLADLLEEPDLGLEEAATQRGFALLGEVDFDHPLFQPFQDPRYSDFTKIHFWNHRALDLPEDSEIRVLARFEGGDPFLLERRPDPALPGRLLVMASGWEANDSDLARSTKFAPLLQGLARLAQQDKRGLTGLIVGDAVAIPAPWTEPAILRTPSGQRIELAAGQRSFDGTKEPGTYELESNGRSTLFQVSLDPAESRTEAMDSDVFALRRVPVTRAASNAANAEGEERQELGVEIEERQKLWRWLLLAGIAGLLVETTWAGRLARAQTTRTNEEVN